MAEPLGTVLADAAVSGSPSGITTYSRQTDGNRAVRSIAERNAIPVAQERTLSAYGDSSGRRGLGMVVVVTDSPDPLLWKTYRLEVAGYDDLTPGQKVTALENNDNWRELVAGGVSYTDEQAQDAAAALFLNGAHTGISFVYDDETGVLKATVATVGEAPAPAPLYGSMGQSTDGAMTQKATTDELAKKVDKVTGKGLSTNDYTNADKVAVGTVANKVDKEAGKGLSTNDYTTAEKNTVATVANKVDQVAGKGLSTEDFTTARKDKLENLPTNPVRTVNGVAADANGNVQVAVTDGAGAAFKIEGITETQFGFPTAFEGTSEQYWRRLLVKSYAPVALLTADNDVRQPGAPTAVTLRYSVTPKTNPVASIMVGGAAQSLGMTSGTVSTSTPANTDTTFSMVVTDNAGLQGNAVTYVRYVPRRFWFLSAVDPMTLSAADLSALVRAASGQEHSASREQSRVFEANGQYLCFAWIAAAGAGAFSVNGLANNAFQSKEFAFVNSVGFTQTFRISRGGQQVTGRFTASVN